MLLAVNQRKTLLLFSVSFCTRRSTWYDYTTFILLIFWNVFKGNIYMYYETSFSRRLRWKVSLKTDQDLRGCFCVILSQCHNVQNNKNHRFEVVAGEETLYHIDHKRESWKKLALQVDTDKFIKVSSYYFLKYSKSLRLF